MAIKIGEIIPEKYHAILKSILPGGPQWDNSKVDGCLASCPFYDRCKGNGPSGGKLCSDDWGMASTCHPIVWMVMKHTFDNFDFYNQGDLDKEKFSTRISEISDIFGFPFEENLSSTEALSIVKIRLKQAEFKAKLFVLWDGDCSLNIDVGKRYLVASHIVPWSKSNDEQKVSEYNGYLLPPNYDYLFDRHLISFSKEGAIIFHKDTVDEIQSLYQTLGIEKNTKLRMIHSESTGFLERHRDIFKEIGVKLAAQQPCQI